MAQDNKVATIATSGASAPGHGMGGDTKSWTATLEIAAGADSNTSTYDFGWVPANAEICGASSYSIDDCDTNSTATIDFGLFADGGNIATSDDDAINDGIVLGTAATRQPLIKNIDSYGKRAWRFVSGQSTEPKGRLLVRGTIKDASPSAGGTVTVELFYRVP